MLAAAMFLTCAVTSPSVKGAGIVHNISLPQDVAEQMASRINPAIMLRFTNFPTDLTGWVLSSGMGRDTPQVGVSLVQRIDDPVRPFSVRSGVATRVAEGVYGFKETMRGTCKLAREEELK